MTTCNNASDGQGNFMEMSAQDKVMRNGFLIIKIGLPGTTRIPETLDDFHLMQSSSTFPILPFDLHVQNDTIEGQQEEAFSDSNEISEDNTSEKITEEVNLELSRENSHPMYILFANFSKLF